MDSRADNLTPEERWHAQQAMGVNAGGFLSIVVDRLLKEPPPPNEPYTPPEGRDSPESVHPSGSPPKIWRSEAMPVRLDVEGVCRQEAVLSRSPSAF